MRNIVIAALVFASTSVCAGSPSGDVTFNFEDWAGPSLPVRLFVPKAVESDTPIDFVMHGASRDVERYYRDWRTEAAHLLDVCRD